MRLLITTLLLNVFLAFSTQANELPEAIDKCFKTAVRELMLVNRDDRSAVMRLFLKYTDNDRLGANAVGGLTWRNASKEWRAKALDMYFELLYTKGDQLTAGMNDVNNTVINSRLAERPDIKSSQGYHVVASVQLDNGNSFAVAILVTKNCKAFDFSQGGWASRFLDASDVDAAM